MTGLPHPTERPTITVDEAARLLGIGRGAAYAAAREGQLPTLRIGRRLLVPTAHLRRLLGVDHDSERKDGRPDEGGRLLHSLPTPTSPTRKDNDDDRTPT